MEHISNYLSYVNILLVVSILLGVTFRVLRLSPVLGYFVSGALIAKAVAPGEGINIFAEFGIVFLLFVIGLELTLKRLIAMSKHVFGTGGLQVLFSTLLLGVMFLYYSGYRVSEAFVTGAVFAMSSTAMVLQVLHATNRQSTPVGRLALAILIFQDLAVVPLLVLVPLLGATEGKEFVSAVSMAIGRGFLVLLFIFVIGRIFLRPIFRVIVSLSSQELFLSTTIFVILGASYLTEKFGLSMALGAFVAGLLMAETEYRDEVEHVIMPFKSLLLGLFFMTVGMSINFDLLMSAAKEIILLSSLVLFIKFAVIFVISRLFGFKTGPSIQAGLLLAQGGEFAFILLGLAKEQNILSDQVTAQLMMTVTLTMALTPPLAMVGNKISDRLSRSAPVKDNDVLAENSDLKNHVIIAGFGNFGKSLARILATNNIYYVSFDISNQVVNEEKKNGYVVYRGDATKSNVYDMLAVRKCASIVVTIGNPVTANKAIEMIQKTYPSVNVISHVIHLESAKNMAIKDKENVYAADLETAIRIAGHIITRVCDINPDELAVKMNRIRSSEYNALGVGVKEREGENS